jgi:hypothetical protein
MTGTVAPWVRLAAQVCAFFVLFGGWLVARDARASHGGLEAMTRVSLSVLARLDTEGTCSVEQALDSHGVQGVLDPCVAALMRAGSIEQRLESGVVDHAAHRCSASLEAMFAALQRAPWGGASAAGGGAPPHAPLAVPAPIAPELPWIVAELSADLPLAGCRRVVFSPAVRRASSLSPPLPPLPPPEIAHDLGSGLRA